MKLINKRNSSSIVKTFVYDSEAHYGLNIYISKGLLWPWLGTSQLELIDIIRDFCEELDETDK